MSGRILKNMIEVRQGDSFSICFNIHREDELVRVDNAVIKMQVVDDNGQILLSKTAFMVEGILGRAVIELTPEDTANMEVGDYKTDIEIRFENGEVHTIFPSEVEKIATFRVTEQITR